MEAQVQRPMGRPREARADRAILAATLELIAEVGVHEFRTEDVAARAQVGKGAIYRRYRSKDELVTAAVALGAPINAALVMTGSLLRFLPGSALVAGMRDLIDQCCPPT